MFLKVGNLDDKAAPGLDQDVMNKKAHDDEEAQIPKNSALRSNEEIDTSFGNNLKAVLYQRYHNYRRNRFALFNDAVLPALLLLLGVSLSQIDSDQFNMPSRLISPDRLPRP